MEEFAGGPALDAGLIAAAQAVEHYEIARYGALRSWAELIGLDEVEGLLDATLTEEKETDALLTELGEAKANVESARPHRRGVGRGPSGPVRVPALTSVREELSACPGCRRRSRWSRPAGRWPGSCRRPPRRSPPRAAVGPLVIGVDAPPVGLVPGRVLARGVARPGLERPLVQVDHVAALAGVVAQRLPGQGMAAPAHAEEAAEGHHRVGDLAGELVDHEVVGRAQALALAIVDRRALDLVRGDQAVGLVGGDAARAGGAASGAGGHRDLRTCGGDC